MLFSELTDKAKQSAIDAYREFQCDQGWDEFTLDDARECMGFLGFSIEEVYYSGFCSQGDGACFTGNWYASGVSHEKLAEHAPIDAELARICAGLTEIANTFKDASTHITHRGTYYHSYSTSFETQLFEDNGDDDLKLVILRAVAEKNDTEKALIDLARDAMNWIYKQLEAEYDYQNSDEAITDVITNNDYNFDEDGTLN